MTISPDHALVLLTVTVVWIVLWIFAVVSISRNRYLGSFGRGMWIVVAIIFPFLGPLAWLLFHPASTGPLTTN